MATNEHGHEIHPCARCGEETEQNDGLWLCAECAGGAAKKAKAVPKEESRTAREGRR